MSKKKVIITLLTTMIAIILSFILGKTAYWNKDRPTLYINNNHKKTEIYNEPKGTAYMTSYTYEEDQSKYLKEKYKIKEKNTEYLKDEIKNTIDIIEFDGYNSIEFNYNNITANDYMVDKSSKTYSYIQYYDVESKTLYIFYQDKEEQKNRWYS